MQVSSPSRDSQDSQPPPGMVELREDVPLKAGGAFSGDAGNRCCGGGPRFILGCFAALSAGVTLAVLTQIYYGDYEVVPHGSVSSSAANCSRAGTDVLKAGGGAVDAAAAAALCLAVLAPHRTSLDASGALLYWEYRTSHSQPPTLSEWGGPDVKNNDTQRPPRLLAALTSLHSKYGVLPWSKILQPAINLAKNGFPVSEGLAAAVVGDGTLDSMLLTPGSIKTSIQLANYLETLQGNSSSDLSMSWGSGSLIRSTTPHGSFAGGWKVYAGGAGADVVNAALAAGLQPPLPHPDEAFMKVVNTLLGKAVSGPWPPAGVATGLAVVDRLDTYVALVTGLSKPLGSGPKTDNGWFLDEPSLPLDLAPAIIVDEQVCGTRYVIGAESSAALAQGAAALLTGGVSVASDVERPRVAVYPGGVIGMESARVPPAALPVTSPALVNATLPYAAVNVVQQTANALMSHADSRGGGLASRF